MYSAIFVDLLPEMLTDSGIDFDLVNSHAEVNDAIWYFIKRCTRRIHSGIFIDFLQEMWTNSGIDFDLVDVHAEISNPMRDLYKWWIKTTHSTVFFDNQPETLFNWGINFHSWWVNLVIWFFRGRHGLMEREDTDGFHPDESNSSTFSSITL